MTRFRLEPDVMLESGARAGALYAVGRRTVHALRPDEARILRDCERGVPLEQIPDGESKVTTFLERLRRDRLGRCYEGPVVVDRYVHASRVSVEGYYEPPLALDAVYLQLVSGCELSCADCDPRAVGMWQGCHSCHPWPEVPSRSSWTREALDDLLDQLAPLPIGHVYVAGGNPLLAEDLLRHLVERMRRARRPAIVIVTTNGIGLSANLAQWMAARGGAFNLVRLGPDREASERVSQSSAAYDAAEAAIDRCRAASAKFYVTLRFSDAVQTPAQTWREQMNGCGAARILLAETVRRDRTACREVRPLAALQTTGPARVPQVGPEEMFSRRHVNHCLDRAIAVTADRQVRVCPMIEERLGDLSSEPLQRVFAERRMNRYWKMTKDVIDGCRQCEFRYACVDCTALDLWRNRAANTATLICNYDPVRAVWRNGESPVPVPPPVVVAATPRTAPANTLPSPQDETAGQEGHLGV